jgi:hypothetical protein
MSVTLSPFDTRSVRLGAVAGALAIAMYLARTFVPMPGPAHTACFTLFGPALVFAYTGLHPLLQHGSPSLAGRLATVAGIVGGATNMMFAVVQLNTLHVLRAAIAAAETAEAKAEWRHILRGVFTVQNGLNITMDFFIDLSALLYALVMWRHPAFGRAISLASVALVGPHLVMKAITFPVPPAEAGLFDAGPLVGVWFTLVTACVVRCLWRQPSHGRA